MTWHLNILPPLQRNLWEKRLQHGMKSWVLYGGTALALQLGHRTSVDFDFFSSSPFDPLNLKQSMGWTGEILQAERNTLTLIQEGVKLSFFGRLSLGVIAPPLTLDSCSIASLEDLAGCKLAALINRVELKDYLDIVALLHHGYSLSHLLGCANAIYHGQFPISVCLKSLAWFEDPALKDLSTSDKRLLEQSIASTEAIPTIPLLNKQIGT